MSLLLDVVYLIGKFNYYFRTFFTISNSLLSIFGSWNIYSSIGIGSGLSELIAQLARASPSSLCRGKRPRFEPFLYRYI